jgi:hypothetical protein
MIFISSFLIGQMSLGLKKLKIVEKFKIVQHDILIV